MGPSFVNMMSLSRKRNYGGQRKYVSTQTKKKTYKKGSGVSATGAFQTFRKRDELGTVFANNTVNVGLAGTDTIVYLLNATTAGSAYNQRSSPSILMKSVELNFGVYPGTSQVDHRVFRALILYDKQPNGAQPTDSFILNTDLAFGFIEPGLNDRFTILYSELFGVGPFDQQDKPEVRNVYRKLSLQSTYDGEAGNVGDIETGALYLVLMANNAVSGATQPVVRWSSKMRFVK